MGHLFGRNDQVLVGTSYEGTKAGAEATAALLHLGHDVTTVFLLYLDLEDLPDVFHHV